MRITVVSAGVGSPSTTTMLSSRITAEVTHLRQDTDVRSIELRELAGSLSDATVTGIKSAMLQEALQAVVGADALVMATPIYKGSFSGLFKLFVDLLDQDAIVSKPVLLAATGGTVRHSLALDGDMRALFGYMRALVVPTVIFAAPEDWGSSSRADALSGRIRRGTEELLALALGVSLPTTKALDRNRPQDIDPKARLEITFDTPMMRLATGGAQDL